MSKELEWIGVDLKPIQDNEVYIIHIVTTGDQAKILLKEFNETFETDHTGLIEVEKADHDITIEYEDHFPEQFEENNK